MGVFSTNRYGSLGSTNFPVVEGYVGEVGIATALIESTENDMAMFNAILASDFNEAVSLKEGALDEASLQVMHENVVTNIFDKIKELLVKLGAKIKAIFHQFMAKINGVFMKDNKELVKKYQKEVITKDLSKLKVKMRKNITSFNVKFPDANNYKSIMNDTDAQLEKLTEEISDDTILCKMIGRSVRKDSVDAKDFHEEFMNASFEDEDEMTIDIRSIIAKLNDASNVTKMVKKANDEANKAVTEAIKEIEKLQKAATDSLAKSDEAHDAENRLKAKQADVAYKYTTVMQTATLKITTESMAAVKFDIKQNRSIFMKAVAWNPAKHVDENADLMRLVEEVVDDEIDAESDSPVEIDVDDSGDSSELECNK